MKLKSVTIKNFRSIFTDDDHEALRLEFGEGANFLVGPNNVGKSNVLRALALALDPSYFPVGTPDDVPSGKAWAWPTVTVEFEVPGGSSRERTLLRYVNEYEKAVKPGQKGYADTGCIRYRVSYQGKAAATRLESFVVKGAGAQRGDPALLAKALSKFHECCRFVFVESGESLRSLLEGKFSEILHVVLQENLADAMETAENQREAYIDHLRTGLLDPLRGRVYDIVKSIFPEISAITLTPSVSHMDETLSRVDVKLTDLADTPLIDKGTGVRGGVTIALLRYLAEQSKRSMIFAIEEPESFLHPGAQEELRDDFEELARRDDVSVLITTHSPFVVSSGPEAKLIEIAKDPTGRTYSPRSTFGDQPAADVIGGLFRDLGFARALDRLHAIPSSARGAVIVEGQTDADYLRLVAEKAGRADLISDIHIVPSQGAKSAAVNAVLLRSLTNQTPVIALFDCDPAGDSACKMLKEKFDFDSKREVATYRMVFKDTNFAYEAEDLFPTALMKRFVKTYGDEAVLKSRTSRKDGGVQYDLNGVGKQHIAGWLDQNLKASHCGKWIELLELLRTRLGLPVDA